MGTSMGNFDLDRAIKAWRKGLTRNRAFFPEDLDELEGHLRDHIEELTASGLGSKEALEAALRRLGQHRLLEGEFRKVRRGRSKRAASWRSDSAWTLALVGNYLRIATRTLRRHAFFTSLNVAGLAVGLASCLLILLYLQSEFSYDRFHEDGDRIHRLNWDFAWDGREGIGSGTPPPLAAALLDEIPGIEAVTRLYSIGDVVVRRADRFFTEGGIVAVDSSFLRLFTFPLLRGNAENALSAPGSIILTESAARKYFGEEDPIGQPLRVGEDGVVFGRPYSSDFTVTGVAQDVPEGSHIQFDMLTSMDSHPQVEQFDWSWIWMQVTTYARVAPRADLVAMEEQITDLVARRAPPAFTQVGFSFDELLEAGGRWDFRFQPIQDVYLGSADIGNRVGPTGSIRNLKIFGVVALFVLLIACINAMNLSTARSSRRANEVGVRKALGSARSGLMAQFLTESILFSFIATVLAVALAWMLLGPFNQIAGKSLSLSVLLTPTGLGILLSAVFGVGLLSGVYPGLYLSAFRPVEVLKGRGPSGKGGRRFRSVLVVVQFTISIELIACTLLVRGQMDFFRDMDLGFERQGVMVLSNHDHRLGNSADAFVDALMEQGLVESASISSGVPTTFSFEDYYKVDGRGDEQFEMASYLVDDHFVDTYGLEVMEGQAFQPASPVNRRSVILNQVAVSQFGLVDPVGKRITYPGVGDFTVIGIVRDFNFRSLDQPIRPFGLIHESSEAYQIPNSSISVRVPVDRLQESIAAVRAEWERFAPDQPFEYTFMDQNLEAQYAEQRRLESLFLIFAALAILVACLGLLGLAAFVVERRTKEIGIRKSLGATDTSLVQLLIRDFTKWVLLANLLAWPIAWMWVQDWLEDFAFQTEVSLWPFLVAGLAALAIAVLTVGLQAARAARADPVTALRYD